MCVIIESAKIWSGTASSAYRSNGPTGNSIQSIQLEGMKVVSYRGDCTDGSNLLATSRYQGIHIPQGTTGAQGIQGAIGDTGEQGITYPTGLQGAQGLIGNQGLIGDIGVQGLEGIQGATYPAGSQGIQGTQGIQGK